MACICGASDKKSKKIDSGGNQDVLINLNPKEREEYSKLFHKYSVGEKIYKKDFPHLLGMIGTDLTKEFAYRIFEAISSDGQILTLFEYLQYVNIYHHGEKIERCLVTFNLINRTKDGCVTFEQFNSYIQLILKAIQKVQISEDELLSESDIEHLFHKISKNKPYFTKDDFKVVFFNKPELLSWIDYFKNNDEDIVGYLNENVKSLIIMIHKFFRNFDKLLKVTLNDYKMQNKESHLDYSSLIKEINLFREKLNKKISKFRDSTNFNNIRTLFKSHLKDDIRMDLFEMIEEDINDLSDEGEDVNEILANNTAFLRITGKHQTQPQSRMRSYENSISPFEKAEKKQESAREDEKPHEDGISEKKAKKKSLLQQSLKNNFHALRNKIKSKDTQDVIKEEPLNDSDDNNLLDDKIINIDDFKDTLPTNQNRNNINDNVILDDIKIKLSNTIESPKKEDLHKRLRNAHKKLKIETANDDDVVINIPVKIEHNHNQQEDSLYEDSTIKINNNKLECHKCLKNDDDQYKFMENLVGLSKSLIRSIQWIDVCYHWIERKYGIDKKENSGVQTFDNLEMPKNIHTMKENSNLLKTTDYNFKLLVKAIMGITVATQNTPFYDLLNKHTYKLKDFLKERLYTLEDYGITNNETFYIKEYAPVIFSNIRTIYGMSKKEYLASISPEGFLTELMISSNTIIEQLISTSKSGSMFFYTKDGKMIIKTIPKKEFDFLTKILINYFNHLKNNRYSLLPRIFGCYRLLRICNQEITPLYFITMDNIFCTNRQIHLRYDLKGSTKGRQVLKKGSKLTGQKISFALKDLDLLNNKNYFHVDSDRRGKILEEIKKDSKFLADNSIIDYSLLIGIHVKEGEANKEIFKEQNIVRESFQRKSKQPARQYNEFDKLRQDLNMSEYSNLKIDHEIFTHSESEIENNKSAHIFKDYSDGGCNSFNDNEIYFFGIIDILTEYTCAKTCEYVSKTIAFCSQQMSCVPPTMYRNRFNQFLEKVFIDHQNTTNK